MTARSLLALPAVCAWVSTGSWTSSVLGSAPLGRGSHAACCAGPLPAVWGCAPVHAEPSPGPVLHPRHAPPRPCTRAQAASTASPPQPGPCTQLLRCCVPALWEQRVWLRLPVPTPAPPSLPTAPCPPLHSGPPVRSRLLTSRPLHRAQHGAQVGAERASRLRVGGRSLPPCGGQRSTLRRCLCGLVATPGAQRLLLCRLSAPHGRSHSCR